MGAFGRADENGKVEIIVLRWDNLNKPAKEVRLVADGFEPHELIDIDTSLIEER